MNGSFKRLLAGGLCIRISSGKPFNPVFQDRTDAMDDIIKGKAKRHEHTRKVVSQNIPAVPAGIRQDASLGSSAGSKSAT